jgi:hypothetical protein
MSAYPTFEHISSFYGPGTTLCWVLIFTSIVVSWSFNLHCRSEDSIDNDFIALLAFPTVAAGHLIYQLVHFPGGHNSVFIAKRFDFLAPIEASLTVCETFTSYMAPGLLTLSLHRLQLKRSALIGLIMLMNLVPQLLLHFQPGALNLVLPTSLSELWQAAGPVENLIFSRVISNHPKISPAGCAFVRPHIIDVQIITISVIAIRCCEVILIAVALYALRMARLRATDNLDGEYALVLGQATILIA